jgi:glutamate formiminotransferase
MLSEELNVPIYLYGESQELAYRKELSSIRQGNLFLNIPDTPFLVPG